MNSKTENAPADATGTAASATGDAEDPANMQQVVAAVWTALVAFLGLAACSFFTYVKYQSDHACDGSFLSACSSAFGSDCSATFNSRWSALGGIPITIYGAAFYGVALVLSVSLLLRRKLLDGSERTVLLFAGLADVGVSIVLATYAKVVLHTFCFYCATLYLVSALFLACVLWLHGRGSIAVIRDAARFRWLQKTAGPSAVVIASLSVILTIPQAWSYRLGQAVVGIADCPADVTSLPSTELQEGARTPTWIFADFVDPSCPHCGTQYRNFGKLLADERFRGRMMVHTYLYPRQPNSPCAPPGFDVRAPEVHHDPCLASIAVVCAERLKPTSGPAMLERVFSLQGAGKPAPWFSRESLKLQAAAIGIDSDRMSKCLDDDAAAKVVRAHVAYGSAQGIESTPRLYAIPVIGGSPARGRALRFEGGKSLQIYERILGLAPDQTRTPEGG